MCDAPMISIIFRYMVDKNVWTPQRFIRTSNVKVAHIQFNRSIMWCVLHKIKSFLRFWRRRQVHRLQKSKRISKSVVEMNLKEKLCPNHYLYPQNFLFCLVSHCQGEPHLKNPFHCKDLLLYFKVLKLFWIVEEN